MKTAADDQAASLLAAIVASSSDAIISKTLDSTITSWNTAAERLFGYTAEEMIGQSIRLLIPADRQPEEDLILASVSAGEVLQSFETLRIRKDGGLVHVSVTASPIRDSSGTIVGASKIVRDITERALFNKMLRESEQRFRGIFNSTYQYIGLLKPDGTVLEVNQTALDAVGATLADVIGQPFWNTPWWQGFPQERERVRRAIRQAASGEFIRFEARYGVRPDANAFVDFSLSPVRDDNGKVVLLVPEGRDITASKATELALNESRQRHSQIFENANALMCLLDRDHLIVEINSRAVAAAGVAREALIGTPFEEAPWWSFSAESRARMQDIIARCLTGETIHVDLPYVTGDGTQRWTDFQATPLRGLDGGIVGVVPSGVDITDRKRVEENTRLLMSEVNHRAKNMLAVVNAIARQTAKVHPDEFLPKFTARVQALSANQDLLVRSDWRSIDFGELLQSQLAHFQDLIGTQIHLDGASLRISSDAAQTIGMALYELATNSGKYGALSVGSGLVHINWRIDGSQFQLEWLESNGPPVVAPSRRGFGRTVIESMARAGTGGTADLSFAASGVTWRMQCPAVNILERAH